MDIIKVLAIDDLAWYYKIFEGFIENEPIELVGICKDGAEGLEKIEEIGLENISIILLDLQMPGMDGRKFIQLFLEKYGIDEMYKVQIVSEFADPFTTSILKENYNIKLPPIMKECGARKRMEYEYVIRNIKEYGKLIEKKKSLDIIKILEERGIEIKDCPRDRYFVDALRICVLNNINIKATGAKARLYRSLADKHETSPDNIRLRLMAKISEIGGSFNVFFTEFVEQYKR